MQKKDINSGNSDGRKIEFTTISVKEYAALDYFARLGVPDTASSEDIKKEYRKFAMIFHPDRPHIGNRTNEELTELFKLLNEAYRKLSDEGLRKKYRETYKSSQSSTTDSSGKGDTQGPNPSQDFQDQNWTEQVYKEFQEEIDRLNKKKKERAARDAKFKKFYDALDKDIKNGKTRTMKEYYNECGIEDEVMELHEYRDSLMRDGPDIWLQNLHIVNFFDTREAIELFVKKVIQSNHPEYVELCYNQVEDRYKSFVILVFITTSVEQGKFSNEQFTKSLNLCFSTNNLISLDKELLLLSNILIANKEFAKLDILLDTIKGKSHYTADNIARHALGVCVYTGEVETFIRLFPDYTGEIWSERLLEDFLPYLCTSVAPGVLLPFLRTLSSLSSGYREMATLLEGLHKNGRPHSPQGLSSSVKDFYNKADVLLGKTPAYGHISEYTILPQKIVRALRIGDYENASKLLSSTGSSIYFPDEMKKLFEYIFTKKQQPTAPRNSNTGVQDIGEAEYLAAVRNLLPEVSSMADDVLEQYLLYRFNLVGHPELVDRASKLQYISQMVLLVGTLGNISTNPPVEKGTDVSPEPVIPESLVDTAYSITLLSDKLFLITSIQGEWITVTAMRVKIGAGGELEEFVSLSRETNSSITLAGFTIDEIIVRPKQTGVQGVTQESAGATDKEIDVSYTSTDAEMRVYESTNKADLERSIRYIHSVFQKIVDGQARLESASELLAILFRKSIGYTDMTSKVYGARASVLMYRRFYDIWTRFKQSGRITQDEFDATIEYIELHAPENLKSLLMRVSGR